MKTKKILTILTAAILAVTPINVQASEIQADENIITEASDTGISDETNNTDDMTNEDEKTTSEENSEAPVPEEQPSTESSAESTTEPSSIDNSEQNVDETPTTAPSTEQTTEKTPEASSEISTEIPAAASPSVVPSATIEPSASIGPEPTSTLPLEKPYHIIYKDCEIVDENTYAEGETVILPEIKIEGFIGWQNEDGTLTYKAGDTVTFTKSDIVLYAVFGGIVQEEAVTYVLSRDNSLSFNGNSGNISIDGNFSDWDGLPYSYEYNWDNSQNCWQWGVWVDGVCYKTPEGEYSTDVRHKMQLYCDGQYVYLHIIISRDYGSKFNGEDYQFWIDGNMAAFQVEWPGGGTITGNLDGTSPGTYGVEVRHRDASMSYDVAEGSSGYLKVNENNLNDELEIAIPLSELKRQNESINLDTMSTIEFFTPNLMYRRITSAGTSTFPIILGTICAVIAGCGASAYVLKRKKRKK